MVVHLQSSAVTESLYCTAALQEWGSI